MKVNDNFIVAYYQGAQMILSRLKHCGALLVGLLFTHSATASSSNFETIFDKLTDKIYVTSETSGKADAYAEALDGARNQLKMSMQEEGFQPFSLDSGQDMLGIVAQRGYYPLVELLVNESELSKDKNKKQYGNLNALDLAQTRSQQFFLLFYPETGCDPFSIIPRMVNLSFYFSELTPYQKTADALKANGYQASMSLKESFVDMLKTRIAFIEKQDTPENVKKALLTQLDNNIKAIESMSANDEEEVYSHMMRLMMSVLDKDEFSLNDPHFNTEALENMCGAFE